MKAIWINFRTHKGSHTYSITNHKDRTRTESRRLAEIHRRQADHAKTRTTQQTRWAAWRYGMNRQAVSGKNPETSMQQCRNDAVIIQWAKASRSYSITIKKTRKTTPLTWNSRSKLRFPLSLHTFSPLLKEPLWFFSRDLPSRTRIVLSHSQSYLHLSQTDFLLSFSLLSHS